MTEINDNILEHVHRLHFVGIGGSGMCPLAEILHSKGYEITGSDVNETDTLARLRSLGIPIKMGHRAENVGDAELVVHTAAVHMDNPELAWALEKKIPVMERSRLLGLISRKFDCTVAVSGTHGKTTTTSMLSQILICAEKDPTVIIGGKLPLINSNGTAGKSETMVCEACEYVDTFLQLSPAMSIILNIDADHLDYFKTLDNIIASFHKFSLLTSRTLIVNGDDANSMKAVEGVDRELITFGLDEHNDYYPTNLHPYDGSYYEYDLTSGGKVLCHVHVGVPGRHNVLNSLAVCAAALKLGVTPEEIEKYLPSFHGAGRRFEIYGTFAGVTVVDDYAHHPTEIRATLDAAMKLPHKKVWAVFQPFTFSRTVMWLEEFAKALSSADRVILSPIMGSRETNSYGISSQDVCDRIPGSIYLQSFEEIAQYISDHADPGDFVLTMGGGDIYKAAKLIRNKLKEKDA